MPPRLLFIRTISIRQVMMMQLWSVSLEAFSIRFQKVWCDECSLCKHCATVSIFFSQHSNAPSHRNNSGVRPKPMTVVTVFCFSILIFMQSSRWLNGIKTSISPIFFFQMGNFGLKSLSVFIGNKIRRWSQNEIKKNRKSNRQRCSPCLLLLPIH